ncbi:DnaJ family domain-containing protein [Planktotalea sp.]|uniref:DnaJ family domain-containing protein n=1 Tax=Planktotalea sp. TaxID=2029877 RepID=UPI003296BA50
MGNHAPYFSEGHYTQKAKGLIVSGLKSLVDDAFKRAQENGDFDNLTGAGKPLDKEKLTNDPFARAYSESDMMTPFGVLQKKIDGLRARLAVETDPDARRALQTEIAALDTRKAVEMETCKQHL